MPRFVIQGSDPDSRRWIAYHEKDFNQPRNPRDSREAHGYVQRKADSENIIYVEVADNLGGPCQSLPNIITPEGRPSKPEVRG